MRSPSQHDLGTHLRLVLLNSNKVSKSLQRMHRSRFHSKDRFAAIFHKLIIHRLGIIILTILQTGKRTNTYHITIARHHGYSLKKMLTLVAVHDYTTLSLQLPSPGIHVQDYHIHAQVESRLLSAQASTQTIIEENQESRPVASQIHILETLTLNLHRLGQSHIETT